MADQQKLKLQEREYRLYKNIQVKFREVVEPLQLSNYLEANCLTEDDVDRIQTKFSNEGRSKAAGELLDRLRRRPNWVFYLLEACSHPELGLEHLYSYIKDEMTKLEIRITIQGSDGPECVCIPDSVKEASEAAFTQQGQDTQSVIEQILTEFKSRVDPNNFLECLKSLTEEDEEAVKFKQQQSGRLAAAEELVSRLRSNYKHWKEDLQEALKCGGSDLEDLGEKLSEIEIHEWSFQKKTENLQLQKNRGIFTDEFTKRRKEHVLDILRTKSFDKSQKKQQMAGRSLLSMALGRGRKKKEKKCPDSVIHKMSSPELKDLFQSIESVLCVPKDVEQISFADDLLKSVHFEKVVLELVALSNTLNLLRIKNVSGNEDPGTICVFDVEVVLKKDQLTVEKWNPLLWINESHMKNERVLKVILVHSKSLRVVETKLRVFNEYASLFGSKSKMLHLQHDNEEYDEIAKKSAKAKVSSFQRTIHSLIQSISSVDIFSIVSKAVDQALSRRNVNGICLSEFISDGEDVGTVNSDSYTCRLFVTVRRIKKTLVKNSLRTISKSLGSEISVGILHHISSKLQTVFKHDQIWQKIDISDKIFATIMVEMESFTVPIFNQLSVISALGSLIETFINTVDVNSLTWRRQVAEEIFLTLSKNREDILQKIFLLVENVSQTTTEDLKNVSERLAEWEKNIKCIDIDEVVPNWKKREALKNINGLCSHKSVLNLIAGIKDEKPTLKVFLSIDDQNAKRFIMDNPEIPKETSFEFVVVKSYKEHKDQAKIKNYPIEKNVREMLSKTIKHQGERIHANHSSVVGLGIGNMDCNGQIMPCIIIYCLDKDLVPFGEKPLPKTLEGFCCDIREDFIMFGACFDCHEIAHPNPGCCIGLPSNGIGSAGFLVKTNESGSETSGFLTAAHVAAENWTDLCYKNAFLSELEVSQYNHEIVHPLLPNDNSGQIIGKVKESFCGNWGPEPESVGIDAAFVQNYEQDKAAYRELQPADESELDYDDQPIVLKRGGTTGKTFGRLFDGSYSPCIPLPLDTMAWRFGAFCYFDRCFAVKDISAPFFNLGDSGSGVFLTENEIPTKPLGIAFARLNNERITCVCRIEQVAKAFKLRLYENVEPMET